MSELIRTIDGQTFDPSLHYDGSDAPMFRVMARWGGPDDDNPYKDFPATRWVQALRAESPGRYAAFMAEVKAERQTLRPLTDEEIEEAKVRQIEAEQREADAKAERKQLAEQIRRQYAGNDLLARKAAAQFGVDLDRD